ncbi:MAG: hypothetical protein R2729_17215 [Bryobacteraceae bacterium]
MKARRTSIDIPETLHRKLREAAARRGCSARQLILESIERVVAEANPTTPRRRLDLSKPIVPSRGRPFNLTSEQIHELIVFP